MQKRYFHSCLNTDSYDKRSFERLYGISSKLQEIEQKGEQEFPGFMNLLGDQWASLYKGDPQINPEATGKALAHKQLVQRIMESEEYEKFRENTKFDDFASAVSAISMGENTVEYIRLQKQQNEKLKEQMEQQNKLQKQLERNQQAMDNRRAQGKAPTKSQQQKKLSLEEQLQQMQQDISQELANGMNPGQMLQQAANDTTEAKDKLEDMLSGPQAGSGKAEMQKLPLRDQLELANILKNQRAVKKVAEWAGRFKAIARKKQRSKSTESVERQGIVQGDNLELLLPTELAQFKNPATKLDFLRRFTEKQTLQYAPRGKESTGKGPIVLCLDQSGSMDHLKEQAAGFTLAIAMIAKAQKRDFAYIPFATITGDILSFPKGKVDANSIMKIATEFMNGGTDFTSPLAKAISIIESKERFKNADILFVTDGEDRLSDTFTRSYHNIKKKLQFNCMSVMLKGSQREIDILKTFSDEVFNAADLLETAENSRIFAI
jgi:uncharacterized protein with von Willebrand factor type A (vWA) domain